MNRLAFTACAFALSLVSSAFAQCVPSSTNFCVTHNGVAFVVNGTPRQALTLTAGTVYTFRLNNTPSSHPFYLTTSSTGGGGAGIGSVANVAPNTPQSGTTTVTFSPAASQAGSSVFYQCSSHAGMGARITIAAPVCAADFNEDNTVDFFDYLDFVDAFSGNAASADFNQDSVIDFFDYLDFVDAFAAGC